MYIDNREEVKARNEGCDVEGPALSLYHANARGTGCAVKLKIYPAGIADNSGHIKMTIAQQKTVGDRKGAHPTYPTFDWENSIRVRLKFDDICKFLQVFRGEYESIDYDHGVYHKTNEYCQKIQLRHLIEPVSGYSLEVIETPANGGAENRANLLLSNAEALGLCEALAGCMHIIAFGG